MHRKDAAMKKMKHSFNTGQLLYVMTTLVLVVLLSACSSGQEDASKEVQSSVSNIQESIDNLASSEVAASSNPYDYVKNNEDFKAIIAAGVVALPELEQLLIDSEQDGLMEFIYAIAMEQISKVDMRQAAEWSTGKEFLTIYTSYIEEIPSKVELIADEPINDVDKIDQLKALGTPAIPYIFYAIENRHPELAPALDDLTDNASKDDRREWSVENADLLNLLTNFVEK